MTWSAARRMLAVRLDAIGDVLMTTPAIRALGAGGARVTLLTSSAGSAVARLIPEIADVIVYDAPWMKATPARPSSEPDRDMADRLRAVRFDAAAIFTVYSQNPLPAALLCYLADIPLRLAHCRENPYQLLSDWGPTGSQRGSPVTRHGGKLDLVATVGAVTTDEGLSLAVPDAARVRVRERLRVLGIDGLDGWVLIHPGASAASRRYPAEQFAAVAREIAQRTGRTAVVTGTTVEDAAIEAIVRGTGGAARTLTGLDLAGLAALIAEAPLLVANNSGPVHIAAAVGTPVVDLYALTNPQHTPWRVPHRVLYRDVPCKFCYKSVCPEGHGWCLRGVTPGEIADAAVDLLSDATSRRAPVVSPQQPDRAPAG